MLTGPERYPLTGDEYRQLAQILSARAGTDGKINRLIRRLQDYGAYEDFWKCQTIAAGLSR